MSVSDNSMSRFSEQHVESTFCVRMLYISINMSGYKSVLHICLSFTAFKNCNTRNFNFVHAAQKSTKIYLCLYRQQIYRMLYSLDKFEQNLKVLVGS